NSLAASACSLCPLGRYQAALGASTCVDCKPGTANSFTGQSACQVLPSDVGFLVTFLRFSNVAPGLRQIRHNPCSAPHVQLAVQLSVSKERWFVQNAIRRRTPRFLGHLPVHSARWALRPTASVLLSARY